MQQRTPHFEHLLSGPPLRQDALATSSLSALLARSTQLKLVGEDDAQAWELDARSVERASRALGQLQRKRDIRALVVRLPYSNDAPLAACALACLDAGVSVGLPTTTTLEQLRGWIKHARFNLVIADLKPRPAPAHSQASQALLALLDEHQIARCDVRELLMARDEDAPAHTRPDEARHERARCWYTTSGTTGTPKLITYTTHALLLHASAHEQAGLLDPQRLGGASLNPLLSHSMGMRDVIHALWSDRRALFITPEWLEERPYRVIAQIKRYPPAHITCGPALLGIIQEYLRRFPMLVAALKPHLRCVITSGAQAQPELFKALEQVHTGGAFGMTEAQQLSNTLLHGKAPDTLGSPLPGASMGLVKRQADHRFELYVKAPWACELIDGAPAPQWIPTGDLVEPLARGGWRWCGREQDLTHSTGLGLKVPLVQLEQRYQALMTACGLPGSLVFVAPRHSVGLLGLIFMGDEPWTSAQRDDLKQTIEAAQARWSRETLGELPGSWPLGVGFVLGAPPRHSVGKLDRGALEAQHAPLLERLSDPYARGDDKLELMPPDPNAHPMSESAPYLSKLLELASLDWEYTDAQGDELIATRDGQQVTVLDMVGGYGANLLGHKHPEVLKAATAALHEGVPMLNQGSAKRWAGRLAQRLSDLVGRHTHRRYITCLASTGAEAVELALKHAMLERAQAIDALHHQLRARYGANSPALVRQVIEHNEALMATQRPKLLALKGGFHGKTAGALHALADSRQRAPFWAMLGLETIFLPTSGDEDAQRALADAMSTCQLPLRSIGEADDGSPQLIWAPRCDIVAALVEPILGEGGVTVIPKPWLQILANGPFPLIMDEIQSGLGRSGQWLASLDVRADYYILGKSLGGGVAKISALLIEHKRYQPRFDELRGATFSDDDYSCRVALATLDALEREDAPAKATQAAAALARSFEALQARHPEVFKRIDGAGLMWGIELCYPQHQPSTVMAALASRGLGYMASAYLLNVHHLRLMPTLSAPDTLRVEPSIFITQDHIERLSQGLEALACALERSNLFELLAHATGMPHQELEPLRQLAAQFTQHDAAESFRIERQAPAPGARKVAFIHNPVHTTKLLLADAPPFALLNSTKRLELIDRYTALLELGPMPSFSRNLYDGKVWMMGITMAATPMTLDHLRRRQDTTLLLSQLQQALALAHAQGCQVAVLGAQTSVVSSSGQALLAPEGMQLTSGNALTAAITLQRVKEQGISLGLFDPSRPKPRVAIVGALGNIGQALAEAMLTDPAMPMELMLVGRHGSLDRLNALATRLRDLNDQAPILCAQTLEPLSSCDIIIATISAAEPIINASHIAAERPVIVADISEPHAVEEGALSQHPQAQLTHAGMVALPHDEDFMLSAHSPRGYAFACATEGILLGLSPQPQLKLVGALDAEAIRVMAQLGREHGVL